jgi:hypothetical protein
VSLLSNVDLLAPDAPTTKERNEQLKRALELLKQIKRELKSGNDIFANREILDKLLGMSRCRDFVVNKGHYFGTNLQPEEPGLSDSDKRALVAFVKTF